MQALSIVILVVFGFGLLLLVAVGMMVRTIFRRQDNPLEDETRMVQDMYRTLNKLEERVAVLETLLAERHRPQGS